MQFALRPLDTQPCAQFLHGRGYQAGRKIFRLFALSGLRMHGYEVRPCEGCIVSDDALGSRLLGNFIDNYWSTRTGTQSSADTVVDAPDLKNFSCKPLTKSGLLRLRLVTVKAGSPRIPSDETDWKKRLTVTSVVTSSSPLHERFC